MEINKVKQILESLNTSFPTSVSLYFVEKKRNGYKVYAASIEKDIREAIRDMYVGFLNRSSSTLPQVPYNPMGEVADCVQVTDLETANIRMILSELEDEDKEHDFTGIDMNKINFYYVKVESGEEELFFFRKFNKLKKFNNGLRGILNENNFVRIEEKTVGIDQEVDVLIYDNEAIILGKNSTLQLLFDLSAYFEERAIVALDVIRNTSKVNNFDKFESDCTNDKMSRKRLTKIINTEDLLDNFFNNFPRLPEVIEVANLSMKLDPSGNINYDGTKEVRNEILSCMADRYYVSLVLKEVREDSLR